MIGTRMNTRTLLVWLLVGLGGGGAQIVAVDQAARAAGPEAIEQLLENVRYWKSRNRPDKAAEAWRKILRSDANHRDALAELALYEARNGNKKEARGYFDRLKAIAPQHPLLGSIDQALGLAKSYDSILNSARAAVRSGKLEEGLAFYRQTFGTQPPAGAIGVEYYQTLGGVQGKWREARDGLERLQRENADNDWYALALARHLTYDEASRREGITRLEKLLAGPEAERAQQAQRQGLLWLGLMASDAALFERYLAKHPDDAEVRKKWDDHKAGIVARDTMVKGRERVKAGFVALEAGRADEAEALFRASVKADPNDHEAVSGLAAVLMKKERFDEATRLLTDLSKRVPKRRELWAEPLAISEFWAVVKRAEAARADGKPAEAEKALHEVIASRPKLMAYAELVLANVLNDLKRYDEAEPLFEKLIAADTTAVSPLLGLFELQLRRGDLEKALEINQRIKDLAPTQAANDGSLRAEILRRSASIAKADGNVAEARRILEAALELDGKNRSVLIDLAYMLLGAKDLVGARRAVDQLLSLGAKDRDALIADAWVAYAERRFAAGLEALDAVKDNRADPVLRELRRRFEVQVAVAEAVKLATRGKLIAAQSRLTETHRLCLDSPELLGLIANTWADIGRYEQALSAMYDALNADKSDSPTLKLQLAAILHKAKRETEFLSVMSEIEAAPQLTPDEQRGYSDLLIAWSVRRADKERERGNYPRAFAYLQKPLKDYPEHHGLMNALGRLFVSSGEYEEAYDLFKRVLAADIESREAREGAIRAAVELGRSDEARTLAADGLTRRAEDPNMLLVVGRMHVMLGEDDEAKAMFERGLALAGGNEPRERSEDGSISRLLAGAQARFGNAPETDASQAMGLHQALVREIESIRARHAIRIGTSVVVRSRQGEAGLGQLMALEFPTRVSISTGNDARLTFTAKPVVADASSLDIGDLRYEGLFGTTGVDLFGVAGGEVGDPQAGIELKLAQDFGGMHLEIGSSPLGFLSQTAVGLARLALRFDEFGIKLEAFRATVDESLMSWAGVPDPGTGVIMGGITRNGGRLDLGLDVDNVIYYLYGSAAYYMGSHVAENFGIEGGLGIQWRLYDWNGITFLTGVDVFTETFDKNLRHFTLGHGGYFSPQLFVLGSVPLRLAVRKRDFDFDLDLGLGVAWFNEDASLFYPTDPARQAVRAGQLDAEDLPVDSVHSAIESFAFTLNGKASLAYRLSPSVELGLQIAVHSGHDYEEYSGGLAFTYIFDQKVGGEDDIELRPETE